MALNALRKITRTAKRLKNVTYCLVVGIVVLYYHMFSQRFRKEDIISFAFQNNDSWKRSCHHDIPSLNTVMPYELKVNPLKDQQISVEIDRPSNAPGEVCQVQSGDPLFPLCPMKFKQFQETWNERCHGEKFKVNMSDPCSVLRYLSEVEPWCPRIAWSQDKLKLSQSTLATVQSDITGLEKILQDDTYAWIRTRIRSFWSVWVEAAMELERKGILQKRKRQRIVLYFGGVAGNRRLVTEAFNGGPLGEFVQWSDVISSLYILGHELILSASMDDVSEGRLFTKHDKGCGVKNVSPVDRIFTDITGVYIIDNHLGPTSQNYRCKLLVLDSFGTEAQFNYKYYKEPMSSNGWGKLNLNLRQFMTMYPHSPDNLFMGFVVPKTRTNLELKQVRKKPIAVIYAKRPEYLKGKRKYLDVLSKYIELHGTIGGKEELRKQFVPEYVINHGILNGTQFFELLSEAKVLIGVGFPLEGPAPLDALAHGCFYINPKIFPPISRKNSEFFKDKPTFRKLTSQSPYTEDFISKPYVHTIDIDNSTEVTNAIREILASKETPYLPYQFTVKGMLERVNVFLENLDFCNSGHQWPPKIQMKILKGKMGESCKDVCFNKGFICEPSFFSFVNDVKVFRRFGIKCNDLLKRESIFAPSFNSTNQRCTLQEMPLLYSCVSRDDHVTRLCPCRTYQKDQVAFS